MRQPDKDTARLDPDEVLDAAGKAAWKDFRRDMRTAGYSPHTIRGYADSLAQLALSLPAGLSLLAAGRQEISDYLIGLAGQELAQGTIATRYRRLHRFYEWAAAEEMVDGSPMARVPRPVAEHKAPEILTDAQMSALLATCAAWKKDFTDARDRAMIMILATPGSPRADELAGMTLDDIDLDETDSLLIHGKGRRDRTIGVEDVTARGISRYLQLRARHPKAAAEAAAARRRIAAAKAAGRDTAGLGERAWLGARGPVTRSGVLQIIRSRGRQAGIPGVHPHQLRHTSFDRADNAGLPPRAAARLYGWNSTRMCDVYGRAAAARRAVEAGRDLGLVGTL